MLPYVPGPSSLLKRSTSHLTTAQGPRHQGEVLRFPSLQAPGTRGCQTHSERFCSTVGKAANSKQLHPGMQGPHAREHPGTCPQNPEESAREQMTAQKRQRSSSSLWLTSGFIVFHLFTPRGVQMFNATPDTGCREVLSQLYT